MLDLLQNMSFGRKIETGDGEKVIVVQDGVGYNFEAGVKFNLVVKETDMNNEKYMVPVFMVMEYLPKKEG